MRSDKKSPLKSDKKAPPKVQKKVSIGYNKKSALLEDAITQMNAGKYGRASSALKDLLALDPLNAEARRLFATLHLRLGSLMSARTAFESLAREAMERQDYWLAESLLREYLTAGPRCVPFLEMLGRVYEDKGDVMAAVAEYGKAVEVLLEDPDTENPNRASELFARIRSVAPGSPVAFRFASMFDTVTGQVLQAPPRPAAVDSASEPPQAAAATDSPVDSASAVAMPWEQVEPGPADAPVQQKLSAPVAGGSTEAMDLATPPTLVEAGTEVVPQDNPFDQTSATQPADSSAESKPQLDAEAARSAVASVAEPIQAADQNEPPVANLVPASTVEAESSSPVVVDVPQPTIQVLAQNSSPITEAPAIPAPMPWDQVEDIAAVIPPPIDSSVLSTAEGDSELSKVTELPPLPELETISSAMEVPVQASSDTIAEAPTSLVLMPREQVEDVAAASPPSPGSQAPIAAEVSSLRVEHVELPPAPVVETASPTIELLTQTSHRPIAEAPTSPVAMPWDQIEETTSAVLPTTEPKIEVEGADSGKANEPAATNNPVDSGPAMPPPTSPVASEVTSSGLSWEDILAAVTAMQTSAPPTETRSSTGNKSSSDMVAPEEPTASIASPPNPAETELSLFEAPVSDPLVSYVSQVSSLSAPMPWEQIEIDDVAIPRHEPEPEFGPVSSEPTGEGQDSTVVMPVVPEAPEPLPAAGTLADVTVADTSVHAEATPTAEFRILSPDAPIETRQRPIPMPVEAHEPVNEPALDFLPQPEQSAGITLDQSAERPFRLAESESIAATAADEPSPAPAEPVMGFALAATTEVSPLSVKQADVQDFQAPVTESRAVLPLEPALLVNQPVDEAPVQAVMTPSTQETVVETSAPSVAPSFVVDHPVVQDEAAEGSSQDILVQDVPPAPEQEMSAADQDSSLTSEAEVCEVAGPPQSESTLPAAVAPQPTSATTVAAAEATVLAVVEPEQAAEAAPAAEVVEVSAEPAVSAEVQATSQAEPSAPAPAAGGSLQILWDDPSSALTTSASTGNMLTRWLKKPAEVIPAESIKASQAATVSEELPHFVPTPAERPESISVVIDSPADRSGSSTPLSMEEPAARQKPIRPAEGRAWRRLGRAVTSLVGAGVSTTRSLVALVLTLVGLTLVLIACAIGGIAVTWLVLDEQPTTGYRNMMLVPPRTLEGSGKNGYLLLLGFGAAATQDPVQAGMERRVTGDDRAFAHACLTGEGSGAGTQQGASAEVAGKWVKTADPAAQMRLEATGVKSWVSQAEVSMGRYRQWLNKPFEDWGYGEPISPNCGLILYAHRLYVAEGFAQDVGAGVARLETDLTAWRTVLGQAKTLPVKMLASDALNDDIMVMGGLLLRPDLDERLVSRLAKLAQPLDQAEQSIRWPMQSQFVLATKTLDETITQDEADARPFYRSVAAALPLPKQRRFNAYAQYYEAADKAAAEGRYADLPKQSQYVHAPPYGLGDLFTNPIESLVGVDPLPTWETYAGRVLETDARLRLASLQAWLRRTPPEQDLMTRIAKAGQGLYDPFTGFPMLVNMKKGVIYSVGRDFKDNEAQERFDVVAQIPSSAWVGDKRTAAQVKPK